MVPHIVDTGQRNELVFVAHGAEFALEFGDGGVVQVFLPVEGRRAVVGQHLAGVFGVHGFGVFARKVQVRCAGFAPHQIGVLGIGHRTGHGLVHALAGFVKTFGGALTGQEGLVDGVKVAGHQISGFGVGTRDHQSGYAIHVGSHARCFELLHGFGGRHQHFAAHVAAFFD